MNYQFNGLKMNKDKPPRRVMLFHETCRQGKVFPGEEEAEMLQQGWQDSPLADEPVQGTMPTAQNVPTLTPEQMVEAVKALGYQVMTPVEAEAQANLAQEKVASEPVKSEKPVEKAEDAEALAIDGAENQVDESAIRQDEFQDPEKILELFKLSPDDVTFAELVVMGNALYKLGLRANMKRETVIEKINEEIAKES